MHNEKAAPTPPLYTGLSLCMIRDRCTEVNVCCISKIQLHILDIRDVTERLYTQTPEHHLVYFMATACYLLCT